jgi:hypothetical protein
LHSANQNATRIIEVPFDVGEDSEVLEVASVADGVEFSIPKGNYALRFEYFDSETAPAIRLSFSTRAGAPYHVIIKGDSELTASELVLQADPA